MATEAVGVPGWCGDPMKDLRFMECGHSMLDHDLDAMCNRRREYDRLEQERLDKYGPCPGCEYGLPMDCNHPVGVAQETGRTGP